MALLDWVVRAIYLSINVLGALVVIWGVLEATIHFLRAKIRTRVSDPIRENGAIRLAKREKTLTAGNLLISYLSNIEYMR